MQGTVGRAGEDGGIPPPGDGDSLASSPQGHRAPAHGWRGGRGWIWSGAGVGPPGRPRGRNRGNQRGEGKGPVLPWGEGPWEQRGPEVGKRLGGSGERERERKGGQANTHVHRLIPNKIETN